MKAFANDNCQMCGMPSLAGSHELCDVFEAETPNVFTGPPSLKAFFQFGLASYVENEVKDSQCRTCGKPASNATFIEPTSNRKYRWKLCDECHNGTDVCHFRHLAKAIRNPVEDSDEEEAKCEVCEK